MSLMTTTTKELVRRVATSPAFVHSIRISAPAVVHAMPIISRSFFTPASSAILKVNPILTSRLFPEPHLGFPQYKINDTDIHFKVDYDVPPTIKLEDLHVDVTDSDRFLNVRGETKTEENGTSLTTKFSHRFLMDPTVDKEKFQASFNDGVLTISAPKDPKLLAAVKQEPIIRAIPIQAPKVQVQEPKKVAEPEKEDYPGDWEISV